MKIATWNVNSIKARMDHVRRWLEKNNPDVLLIQELKGLEFPTDDFRAMGYESDAVTQKTYNGVATLSRHSITTILKSLPGDDEDDQARYLETDIKGLRIINIYAPNGNPVDTEKFSYKLAWLNRLASRLNSLREDTVPVVIGGDFNIIPADRDCHDPALWRGDALFRPESVAAFRTFLYTGFEDAFRIGNNQPHQYTFWDYQGGAWPANKGIRIDHFLLSPPVTDRFLSCEIDSTPRGEDSPSDHTPVVIDLGAV